MKTHEIFLMDYDFHEILIQNGAEVIYKDTRMTNEYHSGVHL